MADFDVVVIGGGMGGHAAALRAAQLGGQVALVECDRLGGTCLNRGCVPTKAWLSAVGLVRSVRAAAGAGVEVQGCRVDPYSTALRVREVVGQLRRAAERSLESAGVTLVRGRARLLNPGGSVHRVAVDGEGVVQARSVVLATGSAPAFPPVPGLVSAGVGAAGAVTGATGGGLAPVVAAADDVVDPDREEEDGSAANDASRHTGAFPCLARGLVPSRLVIVGGGVTGVEMASLYAGLGARVTLLEVTDRLVPGLERDIGDVLRAALERDGVEVLTGASPDRLEPAESGCRVWVRAPSGGRVVEADGVLVATGRRPRLEGLEAERSGVRLANGWVWVDDHMRTSVPGVFAAGDVTGRVLLAHVAARQGTVAAENAMGLQAVMDYRAVPGCVYVRPEVAWVGMSAAQARNRGYRVVVGRSSFAGNTRALAEGDCDGWAEVVVEARYGEVLGVRVVGPQASEIIVQAAAMMRVEATIHEWAGVIYPHPSLGEVLAEAVGAAAAAVARPGPRTAVEPFS